MEPQTALTSWANFYVIVGSSAAALTGLQFVVMTLIGSERISEARPEEVSAFGTPNVVHFCAALLESAILSAPWRTVDAAGNAVAASGAIGVIYVAIVIRRARRRMRYQPVLEDWIWHAILPAVAYVAIVVAGIAARTGATSLFVIAGAVLLLVFIGIHNAWDTVTYIAVDRHRE